jgi:hypothetical protein
MTRFVALLLVVPATYFFVYWLPFSLLPIGENRWIASFGSLVAAGAAGWFVWAKLGSSNSGALTSMLAGAVLIGATGFVAGFFGPLIWAPEANQGPLLGIFFTGPLGFVAGGIGGLVYWILRRPKR